MNLTAKEKIDLLEKVKTHLIDRSNEGRYIGICTAILCVIPSIETSVYSAIASTVPELLKYRPIDAYVYWFRLDKVGHEKRIEIIEKTIQDLQNATPKKEISEVYFKCKPENLRLINSYNYWFNPLDTRDERVGFTNKFIEQNLELFEIKYKEDNFIFDNTKSFEEELKRLETWVKSKSADVKEFRIDYSKIFYLMLNENNDLEINFFSGKLESIFRYLIPKFYCMEDAFLCKEQLNLSENAELKNYLLNKLK